MTVTAASGINNSGTINQGIGSLTLNGAVGNTGTINGNDLTINGSLANQAGATVYAGDALTLNGSGTNAGTVQAANTLTISGTSYDNSNGMTQAGTTKSPAGSGNASIQLSGDLTNAGGSLTATNDLSVTASNVVNSAASKTSSTTTTTKTVVNTALLMSTVIGSETVYGITKIGKDGGYLTLVSTTVPATLGGVLSVTGIVPSLTSGWSDGADHSNVGVEYIGVSGPQSTPVATSGAVQYVQVPTLVGYNGNSFVAQTGNLWYVQDGSVRTNNGDGTVYPMTTLTIPTVTETTTTTGAAAGNSVIAAGHDLTLTANNLNNQSGTVSAGHDANVNVQSLSNGGTSATSTITDTVDTASLTAFMNGLLAMQKSGGVSVVGSGNAGGAYGCTGGGGDNGQFCFPGPATPPTSFTFDSPGAVTVQSVSSSATVQGATGQIIAGHDVNLSGGNLTNTGTIAAVNDVTVHATSFANQGSNVGSKTVTTGCASGYSGCTPNSTTNANSETYGYQQANSNVTAGHDIVIAADQVDNTYGNLVAKHDVVIGGAGTTAVATTQASSITNTSGAIEAGNNVNLNGATVTNTIAAPATIHQNYGTGAPYSGCGQRCEAYVEVQSATPAMITADNNLSITAGVFGNTGSLITALNAATINATASASSDNQYLHAYWTGNPNGMRTWGCLGAASTCQNLYGGAFSLGDAQAVSGLPSSDGLADFVPATIQAGNSLAVNSPTLTNTGNVIGQSIALTGSTLVNGITNPTVFTPPPVVSGQVISLGPVPTPDVATTINRFGQVVDASGQPTSVTGAAGLPSNTPIGARTVGQPVAPTVAQTSAPNGTTVKTISGQTITVSFLTNNPAAQVVGSLSPAALIGALPANLQPGNVPFYYDPYTQAQQVEQAALEATGKSSFYSTTGATDSTSQASINNQDATALYGAALQYAEQNNIALGTQLSQAQLAQVNAPMLWYVEQSVPEPGCSTTGGATCPTVQALMPEVLLPQNYAVVNADGEITGTNVALNYANSILNTGTVTAQNLQVNTNSLTNEERSTNIGTIYQKGPDGVTLETTGTVAQQGGFISAASYDLQVQSLNQIGGTLQQINADGSANTAATQQLLTNLKNQLGSQFTQQSVTDHLDTQVVDGDSWFDQIFMAGVMVGLSIMSGMAASGAIGAAAGATAGSGSAFAAAGTGIGALGAGTANVALSAAFAGMMNSTMSQLNGGGSFSVGQMLETGGVAALTAGLTNGITFSDGTTGWSWAYSQNSLAALAGVQSVGNTLVPQAGTATGSLPSAFTALAAESVIQAAAQTGIVGGSFLTNLRDSAVSDVAAVGANAIGNAFSDQQGFWTTSNPLYAVEHAALGCAAGAATGQGCAGGAVGGAASAIVNPLLDANGNIPAPVLSAIETVVGGSVAGALGLNVQGAMTAAQNETQNNWLNHVPAQPGGLSDADQYQQAVASGDTKTQDQLAALSLQNDQSLAQACAGGTGGAACQAQIQAAEAGGNLVYSSTLVNGTNYTFANPLQTATGPESFPTSAVTGPQLVPTPSGPSLAALTLDSMLGGPLAGMMGGWLSGSGSPTDAYYAAQLGNAMTGIAMGAASPGWFEMPTTPAPSTAGVSALVDVADGGAINVQATRINDGSPNNANVTNSNVGFDTSNLESKLDGYLLDPAHPQNQTKANWFSQALGFNQSNWRDLASQLYFDPATAVATKTTQYGQTYEQVIPITGTNGKTINTTFVFMKDNSGTVRLVTGIPAKQ
ncbi:beta strand repeat-containing protein [Burkholderia stagnalis]